MHIVLFVLVNDLVGAVDAGSTRRQEFFPKSKKSESGAII